MCAKKDATQITTIFVIDCDEWSKPDESAISFGDLIIIFLFYYQHFGELISEYLA
jgi:hypothetical protein|tara:strand:+ start:1570 stop:1734 length:165 start_codon:yes stop_codon:yes gene_type:complete